MTMAISKAVEGGARAVICASTGNTSASAAAYGARAGIAVYVLIPAGKIALGKLSQAMMHQATVIQVEGNFDQALAIVKELSAIVKDPSLNINNNDISRYPALVEEHRKDIAELQARIGHSTPNMAMRYQHVAAERDAQLAARMSAFATGGSLRPHEDSIARP